MSQVITGRGPATALPPMVATDGSAVRSRRGDMWWTGFGFINADGTWGCGSCPIPAAKVGPSAATVAELRAVYHAVRGVIPYRAIVIHLDSVSAIEFLQDWAAGGQRMPAGYVGSARRMPMLSRLQLLVGRHHPRLAWQWVPGHAGNLLNEGADSLASIGRRWAMNRLDRAGAEKRAEDLAGGFLRDRTLRRAA